jgi:dipeptidyl aminopeptidase/acylaminoacyl peptidase
MYSTDNLGLFVHDLRRGSTRNLLRATDFCLMSVTLSDSVDASFTSWIHWMPDSQSLLTRVGWQGSGHIARARLDSTFVQLHTPVGAEHAPCSMSRDGAHVALIRSSPTEPPELCVAEVGAGEFAIRQLTQLNTALCDELDLAVPEDAWAKAKDGTRVHYWIMRPPASVLRGMRPRRGGRAKSPKTPAILEVHGGPHGQYGWVFFLEFQLLAAAGYTVFYSNPRGSKGYGRAHCHAIKGTWGGKDWMDVQAVTRAMARDRGVDRTRLGIMGGSYGGYMTLWAVGHSNAYRGAIADRCVSNVVSHCGNSDYPDVPGVYWQGSAYTDPKAMWKSSPIASFGKARTPLLLIHSEGDLRCNIEQSEQIHAAMVVRGVPTRFVRYPRETSHGMSRSGPPDLRIHRLNEILEWWKKIF